MKKDLTIETGMCYIRVGKPVVDGFIKASGSSVVLFSVPFDGDVLVSLDVNGTAVARRELFKMVEGSIAVGDYTVVYANDAVTISTTENNDLVHIRIEPVEVSVSDGFRAAIKKAVPQSGGSTGGGSGVELVKFDVEFNAGSLLPVVDHTVEEIDAAREAGKLIIGLHGFPQQMTPVEYSGDDDYPYSAVFYLHDIEGDSLTVAKHGFFYEEGAWVYSESRVELTGTGS